MNQTKSSSAANSDIMDNNTTWPPACEIHQNGWKVPRGAACTLSPSTCSGTPGRCAEVSAPIEVTIFLRLVLSPIVVLYACALVLRVAVALRNCYCESVAPKLITAL